VETDEQWQAIAADMAVAAAPAIANWAMDKVFNEGEEYNTEQLYEIEFERQINKNKNTKVKIKLSDVEMSLKEQRFIKVNVKINEQ
jgi:hypothetical protein